jgi:hypothetical protein
MVLAVAALATSVSGCSTGLISDVDPDAAANVDSAGTGGAMVASTGGAGGAVISTSDAGNDLPADLPTVADAAPSGLVLKSISAGYSTACGARPDDSFVCWGADKDPRVIGTYKSVAVGGSWNCGLRMDGNVVCFDNLGAAISPAFPPTGPFGSISTGYARGCGVKADGTLACWGVSGSHDVPPEGAFASVSVGGSFACALRTDGTVTC